MDRRIIIGGIAAGLMLAAVVIWAISREGIQPPVTSEPTSVVSSTSTASDTTVTQSTMTGAEPLYLIGSWEDKLAVFAPPDPSPQQVYDVYLSTLPEEEQQRLKDGIAVYDEATLASLLEDYTS